MESVGCWAERLGQDVSGVELGVDVFDDQGGGARPVFDKGLRWLRSLDGYEPFFLFLHTYEVHHSMGDAPRVTEPGLEPRSGDP